MAQYTPLLWFRRPFIVELWIVARGWRGLSLVAAICLAVSIGGCDVNVPHDAAAYAQEDRAARLAAICDPTDPTTCIDDNPCTDDICDSVVGCQHLPNAATCNDAEPCTTADTCKDSACAGVVLNCDDSNVCTSNSCKLGEGCVAVGIPGACDDGDSCTEKDICTAGKCGGKAKTCDDGNVCTTDLCDSAGTTAGAGTCLFSANTEQCDDGDACTEKDECAAKKCTGTAKNCADDNLCTDDSCDSSTGCMNTSNSSPCGKDNLCATGQECAKGACDGGVAVTCKDNNPCTDDACANKTGCTFVANKAACDDGKTCTSGDTCAAKKCAGAKKNCDDGNDCTADACGPTVGCQYVATIGGCDDGNACTLPGKCVAQKCTATGYSCTTDRPCYTASCEAKNGVCSIKASADGTACGEGKGLCSAGACVATGGKKTQWGFVPAGTFWMGCNGKLDAACKSDENPQHLVTITKSYWLAIDEVTAAQYKVCVSAGKCQAASNYDVHCNWGKFGRENHPINCLPWSGAQAYCAWLGGTLPTEAQWEMAARGRCDENGGIPGCKTAMRTYPWGETAPKCGQHAVIAGPGPGCGKAATWPVGAGAMSGRGPYGMRDLSGNVWEWVANWSAAYTASAIVHGTGGTGPSSGATRGARGGAFTSVTTDVRASRRGAVDGASSIYFIGFRCAKDAL